MLPRTIPAMPPPEMVEGQSEEVSWRGCNRFVMGALTRSC
jgi:hypothetical protein